MKELPATDIHKKEMHIQLLGGFAVIVDGNPIPEAHWRSRRARSLVKLLALAPAYRLQRDQVLDAFWPDSGPAAAANSLHQTLYTARQILDPLAPGCLSLEDGLLSLSGGADRALSVDVTQFEAAASQAKRNLNQAACEAALALYTGELLPDDRYEEWTVRRRGVLQKTSLQLLLDLAHLQETDHDYPTGIETLQRLLAVDPCHEDAHAGLMRLYAITGQRQHALRQYQALREVLQADLGAEPGPATRQLFEAIQSGQFGEPGSLPGIPARRHNLPAQLTSFIGREKEIAEVKQLLSRTRLLTLSGVGGTGKTRLALAVANQVLGEFERGVWLVELAPLADPALIASSVLTLLGIKQERNKPLSEILSDYLCNRQMLLILDNCEHLIQEAAQFTETLLHAAPEVKVLATSRESLGLTGETVYLVPSLSAPDPSQLPPIQSLDQFEAVRLFYERATSVVPPFTLSEANATAVVQICKQLDGIPLAIELAAARVKVLSPGQIAARLDDRFSLLTGGSRTAYPRHQTLHALIDWSYELLSEPERSLFRQLSIFRGGWTLAAAEAVYKPADQAELAILDLLAELVNKSLVEVELQAGGIRRYRMLETVRQYAQEQLLVAGEARPVRHRHLDHFLAFAEAMERQLHSPAFMEALTQLDAEIDNLRAALGWAFGTAAGQPARVADGLRLANALEVYWSDRLLLQEACDWVQTGLALLSDGNGRVQAIRARAYFTLGYIVGIGFLSQAQCQEFLSRSVTLYRQCDDRLGLAQALIRYGEMLADWNPKNPHPIDIELGTTCIEEGVALIEDVDDPWVQGVAFEGKAHLAFLQKDYEKARSMSEKCLACFVQAGDSLMDENLLACVTYLFSSIQGDLEKAQHYFEQRLDYAQKANRKVTILDTTYMLAHITFNRKNFSQAEVYFQTALLLDKEFGTYIGIVYITRMLACINFYLGRIRRARQLFLESQSLGRRLPCGDGYGDPYGDLAFILWMGSIAESLGNPALAARLLGAVEAILETFFKPLNDWVELIEYDRLTTKLRGEMDTAAFTAAWAAGRELTFEQALEEALAFGQQETQLQAPDSPG